ncbi:hypothetical protein [Celeribacter halophilus]|uniref:hypothetical protein n=1 Tax=Celeribacter halophilus TaxID=576117 RepID=UPI003A8CC597
MDFIKDIYEAWGARIKSNVFGSIAIVFVFVNWKALFFLLFADVRVTTKFSYFDANTDWITLFAMPVGLGCLLAIAFPYINYVALRLVSWPVKKAKMLQDETMHERLLAKLKFEIERAEKRNQLSAQVVEQAEIESRVKDIEDDDIREKTLARIDEIEDELPERNPKGPWPNIDRIVASVSEPDRIVLQMIEKDPGSGAKENSNFFGRLSEKNRSIVNQRFAEIFDGPVDSRRTQTEYESAIPRLETAGLIKQIGQLKRSRLHYFFTPTSKGHAVLDKIGRLSETE